MAALKRLRNPVDDFLVAPFYLDLIVRLQNAGVPFTDLPEHQDQWRAAVLETYLTGIDDGSVVPRRSSSDSDAPDRGHAAERAAEAVARQLKIEHADLTVALSEVTLSDRALDDAVDLNLLWRGAGRVGFASDDLGAYLVATTIDDPSRLLKEIRLMAECKRANARRDRHVVMTLIFWHLSMIAQRNSRHSTCCWATSKQSAGPGPRSLPPRCALRAPASSPSTTLASPKPPTGASAQWPPRTKQALSLGMPPS